MPRGGEPRVLWTWRCKLQLTTTFRCFASVCLVGLATCQNSAAGLQQLPGKCLVDGGYVGWIRVPNPTNACQSCSAMPSVVGSFVAVSDGSPCDGGICVNGVCGLPLDGAPCDGGVWVGGTCTPGCWLSDAGYIYPTGPSVGPGFVPPTTAVGDGCDGCRPEADVTMITYWPTGTPCDVGGGPPSACWTYYCTCDNPSVGNSRAVDGSYPIPCCAGTRDLDSGVCCTTNPNEICLQDSGLLRRRSMLPPGPSGSGAQLHMGWGLSG